MAKVLTEVFGIWYLIGAAFVFFMQEASQWLRQGSLVLRMPKISS